MSDEYSLLQQRIRERAYVLWEEAGSPDGEDERFWSQAKIEIDQDEAKPEEMAGSSPASDPLSSSVVTGATGETKLAGE